MIWQASSFTYNKYDVPQTLLSPIAGLRKLDQEAPRDPWGGSRGYKEKTGYFISSLSMSTKKKKSVIKWGIQGPMCLMGVILNIFDMKMLGNAENESWAQHWS